MPTRTIFYIDGFNFYHGLKAASSKLDKSWRKYYWIDFVKFARQFLDDSHELVCVKYFTASPLQLEKEARQSALFKANKFINGDAIQFIKGKYYKKPIKCQADCNKYFEIYEEKRTDVNIAVEMIGDVALDKVDLLVLISADSDLVPPIEFLSKNYAAKRIKVFFPPCKKSTDVFSVMNKKVVFLDSNKLKFEKSIMPDVIEYKNKSVAIPDYWILKKDEISTEST